MTTCSNAAAETGVEVEEVDQHDAEDNLDRLARRFLGMSGPEFLKRRRADQLHDADHLPGFSRVLAVATLLD